MRSFASVLIASLVLLTNTASAEDLDKILTRVKELTNSQNFPKAIEELKWAEKEINDLHLARLKSFFPPELEGLKSDPKIETNTALGMVNVERRYSGAGKKLDVSLTGGGAGGMAGNPFGGLAGLGKMAAMMGGAGNNGTDTMRIDGRTATVQNKGSSTEMMVFLEGDYFLKLDLKGSSDRDFLKGVVSKFDLKAIESYLKG